MAGSGKKKGRWEEEREKDNGEEGWGKCHKSRDKNTGINRRLIMEDSIRRDLITQSSKLGCFLPVRP